MASERLSRARQSSAARLEEACTVHLPHPDAVAAGGMIGRILHSLPSHPNCWLPSHKLACLPRTGFGTAPGFDTKAPVSVSLATRVLPVVTW